MSICEQSELFSIDFSVKIEKNSVYWNIKEKFAYFQRHWSYERPVDGLTFRARRQTHYIFLHGNDYFHSLLFFSFHQNANA